MQGLRRRARGIKENVRKGKRCLHSEMYASLMMKKICQSVHGDIIRVTNHEVHSTTSTLLPDFLLLSLPSLSLLPLHLSLIFEFLTSLLSSDSFFHFRPYLFHSSFLSFSSFCSPLPFFSLSSFFILLSPLRPCRKRTEQNYASSS